MVSVLLTLLKIIGIVLLSLLGLFIVLLLLVLFVPVRYRFKGYYKENEFVCHGKITWLLHLVSLSLDYDKEFITSIKIFGINISSLLQSKKELPADKEENHSKPKEQTDSADTDSASKEYGSTLKQPISESVSLPAAAEKHSASVTADNKKTKKNIFSKVKELYYKIKEKCISVYNKLCDLISKIKQCISDVLTKKEKLEYYISILKREDTKQAFSLCKTRLWKMIKHLLPKNMRVHLRLGLEDPSSTGYILGAYSVLPEYIRKKFILQAEFERRIIDCDYTIKGYANVFHFLRHIIVVVFDKNCRSFYNIVKKEISNERK